MKRASSEYRSVIEPVWCPGCGDYGVLKALQNALCNLELDPEEIVAVSGIGCSGRLSHFLSSYSLHGTHGRAVPTAMGAKAVRPDLTVLCIGGDGDGLGIGGGHIPHAARKNVDLTYLLLDNQVYGLTKGQSSPTTPLGRHTKTSPHGVWETPMNPLAVFLAYDVSFIARASGYQVPQMTELIEAGLRHRGFSIVHILSPCQTFPVLDAKSMKSMLRPLPDDHSPTDRLAALRFALDETALYTGIFYQVDRPTLGDRLQTEVEQACPEGVPVATREVLESFV